MGDSVMTFNPEWEARSQELGLWQIRQKRNVLLAESDWTQSNDSPLSDAEKTAWAEYRQSLRDITTGLVVTFDDKDFVDESAITWPTKP